MLLALSLKIHAPNKIIISKALIYIFLQFFPDNPLHCDCFLRPLARHLHNQLLLPEHYKEVACATPPYLSNVTLLSLTEDRLNCPINVNTTRIKDATTEDYDVLPDIRFRELTM